MSGSGNAASKAGSGGHTPAWEAAGLELSIPHISKKGEGIPLGGIRTIFNGEGHPTKSQKFVAPGSREHPGALDRRIRGDYKPRGAHGAPTMRMAADAKPKKETKPGPYEPLQLTREGVVRNDKKKIEPNYGVKDPNKKTLTLESRDGTKFPFKVSGRPTDTHTVPVKAGGKTYYMTEKDSTDYKVVSHLFGLRGGPARSRVA